MNRDPYDGLPYYCSICGEPFILGPDRTCMEIDCTIETKQTAEARQRRRRPLTTAALHTDLTPNRSTA